MKVLLFLRFALGPGISAAPMGDRGSVRWGGFVHLIWSREFPLGQSVSC